MKIGDIVRVKIGRGSSRERDILATITDIVDGRGVKVAPTGKRGFWALPTDVRPTVRAKQSNQS